MSSGRPGDELEVKALPVHGFVLAGGRSSRMGVDKARLEFCGRPLLQIAVAKLWELCVEVSVVGDREDLHDFAPVVRDARADAGPGAGMEAALAASSQEWAMFLAVDVPLVPVDLLWGWVSSEVASEQANGSGLLRNCGARLPWASYLVVSGRPQPAIALMHRDCLGAVSDALDAGARKLLDLFEAVRRGGGVVSVQDAAKVAPAATQLEMEVWFSNLNTPSDFEEAELWEMERLK